MRFAVSLPVLFHPSHQITFGLRIVQHTSPGILLLGSDKQAMLQYNARTCEIRLHHFLYETLLCLALTQNIDDDCIHTGRPPNTFLFQSSLLVYSSNHSS